MIGWTFKHYREITSELKSDYVGAKDLDRDAFRDAAFSCDVGVTSATWGWLKAVRW
jgi:hypothetical protein